MEISFSKQFRNKVKTTALSVRKRNRRPPTKRRVADALAQSTGKDDFIAKLNESNIDVVFLYTDEGRIYGVTFVDYETQTALNGSRLGKRFHVKLHHLFEFQFGQCLAISNSPFVWLIPRVSGPS